MDNNRLLRYLPLEQTYSVVDQIIAETIKGITETITQPSLINLDYADVRTVMRTGGASLMFVGEADLSDDPDQIVRTALGNPLLDVDYSEVTGCLLHITGGLDLTLKDAAEIAGALTQKLGPKANVIWGARIKSDFERKIRLTTIATGVKSAQILSPNKKSNGAARWV
jgi:cell division protein FtsZ